MQTLVKPTEGFEFASCGCRLPEKACCCREVEPVECRTQIHVVMHQHEVARSSNTGLLACRLLKNSALSIYGAPDARDELVSLKDPEVRQVILFPGGKECLTPDFANDGPPLQLIVPDGNWRQGRRMSRSLIEALQIPSVSLPSLETGSAYRLRKDKRGNGLGTAEAIAHSLRALGERAAADRVEQAFLEMVERVLLLRLGGLSPEQVAKRRIEG